PVAILVQFLVAFGSVIGRGAYFVVEADRHFLNLFVAIVGATSKGRKGTSWGHVRNLFRRLDDAWAKSRVSSGLASGEGLISHVRDPIIRKEPIRKKGLVQGYQEVIVDHGIEDKRLLVVEPELASTLRIIGREGNKLSATIRQAWDTGDLAILNKNTPV